MDDEHNYSGQYVRWNEYAGEEARFSEFYLLRDKFRKIAIENPEKKAETVAWYYNEAIRILEYDDEKIADLQKTYMKTFGKKFIVQKCK